MSFTKSLLLSVAMIASLTQSAAQAGALNDSKDENPNTAATNWSPVLFAPTFAPRPFAGSEKQWHLVYDALLTNYSKEVSEIKRLDVMGKGDSGEWKLVKSFDEEALKKMMTNIGGPDKSTKLPAACVAPLFINLDFDKETDVPKMLAHRIVVATKIEFHPDDFEYKCGELAVEDKPAVKIGSPLRGGKWIAIGGYVGVAGHRQALFAIDNALHSAQLFAIDWVRLDDTNHTSHDVKKLEQYACFGEPVYAVSDGKIAGVVNKFQNQVPPTATGNDRFSWPGGNSVVQEMGNGYYAFYAHMKPGSILVKDGDIVKKGQQIGSVGNTGNTTGPHLHMHVTRNPGVLQADGVPYVFDEFDVLGQVKDMDKFVENDESGKPQTLGDSQFKGMHKDELIRDGFVVQFK